MLGLFTESFLGGRSHKAMEELFSGHVTQAGSTGNCHIHMADFSPGTSYFKGKLKGIVGFMIQLGSEWPNQGGNTLTKTGISAERLAHREHLLL